ncbi:MAG: arginase family protein [Alicyclobacillaceae bacterium]|nr:arginase family protein [Alicyclobacillaceae bacterium]
MYTGDSGVTFFNFDNSLKPQDLRLTVPHEWIECSDIPGLRGMCDAAAARELRRRLRHRRYRGVSLVGSGLYHHVTYFLLEDVRVPFTLVLFDQHTDLAGQSGTADSVMTCGSWVSWAVQRLQPLRRVVIVGARPSNCPAEEDQGKDIRGKQIHIISEQAVTEAASPKAVAHWLDAAAGGWPVYVSVDKDVLRPDDAATDWGSGSIRLRSLLYWLVWLRRTRRIVGVDICGEWPASPMSLMSGWAWAQIRKNESANQAILRAVLTPPAGLAG